MRSIKYTPAPKDEDPRFLRLITKDYIFQSPEYPGAWEFREVLKHVRMPFLDFDDYILDDFEIKNGIIQSCWTIFFSARPDDVLKLDSIVDHLRHGGVIYDEIPWK